MRAFDSTLDLDERAVGHEVRDLALDRLADREAVLDLVPRVVEHLLEAERHALLLLVDVEDDDFELVADLDELARVIEAGPRHVGDVEQAVDAVEVDERAEIGDVLDRAGDLVANLHSAEEGGTLGRTLGLDDLAAAQDDVLAVVVDLDDLEIVSVADELLEIARRDDVDLRGGEEGLDAHVDGEAAFDDGLDLALDEAAFLEHGDDLFPVLALGGFFLREDDHALVVFEADEEDLDFVADFDVFGLFEFIGADDAFGFVADVDEKFAGTDFEDMSLDDAALAVVFGGGGKKFRQIDICHKG